MVSTNNDASINLKPSTIPTNNENLPIQEENEKKENEKKKKS